MVFDSLTSPWDMLDVSNPTDFLGMLVFDLWTNNHDERQVIFVNDDEDNDDDHDDEDKNESANTRKGAFRALMIDQNECFGGETWTLMEVRQPFRPYRGIFDNVKTLKLFEPWLSLVINTLNLNVLYRIACQIPQEWMNGEALEFEELLQFLASRRKRLPELLYWLIRQHRDSFPRWTLSLSMYTPARHTATPEGRIRPSPGRTARHFRNSAEHRPRTSSINSNQATANQRASLAPGCGQANVPLPLNITYAILDE